MATVWDRFVSAVAVAPLVGASEAVRLFRPLTAWVMSLVCCA